MILEKTFSYFVFTSYHNLNQINQTTVRHTITLDDLTFRKLRDKGRFGESYCDLISRLIDSAVDDDLSTIHLDSVRGTTNDTSY